jgi:hypothetical protein
MFGATVTDTRRRQLNLIDNVCEAVHFGHEQTGEIGSFTVRKGREGSGHDLAVFHTQDAGNALFEGSRTGAVSYLQAQITEN